MSTLGRKTADTTLFSGFLLLFWKYGWGETAKVYRGGAQNFGLGRGGSLCNAMLGMSRNGENVKIWRLFINEMAK